MDLTVLKKKISSYRTPKGRVTSLPNELLGEILHAWEQWTGSANAFYSAIGTNHRKMASIMGKAKQLKRDGAFEGLNFTEIVVDQGASLEQDISSSPSGRGIELIWGKGKIIRFYDADLLVDFLQKSKRLNRPKVVQEQQVA